MKIYIDNMICDRCLRAVSHEFEIYGVEYLSIRPCEVELRNQLRQEQTEAIEARLRQLGFRPIHNKRAITVCRIKSAVIEYLLLSDNHKNDTVLSAYISGRIGKDYRYLSGLFSSLEGTTIENFFIQRRILKVQELLSDTELSLSEIAWNVGYSSLAHMSAQFKKYAGQTPSSYRKQINSFGKKNLNINVA